MPGPALAPRGNCVLLEVVSPVAILLIAYHLFHRHYDLPPEAWSRWPFS